MKYFFLILILFFYGCSSINLNKPKSDLKKDKLIFFINPVLVKESNMDNSWIEQYNPKETPFFGHNKNGTIFVGTLLYKSSKNNFVTGKVNLITIKENNSTDNLSENDKSIIGNWTIYQCENNSSKINGYKYKEKINDLEEKNFLVIKEKCLYINLKQE